MNKILIKKYVNYSNKIYEINILFSYPYVDWNFDAFIRK